MATKWKKFRYGTEDVNPTWSFYATVFFLGLVAISFGMVSCFYDSLWWALVFASVVLALVSLGHLNLMMCNGKQCGVPVGILDGRWPDLFLALLLGMVLWNRQYIWYAYCSTLESALDLVNYAELLLLGILMLLLLVYPAVTVLVFLVMSVTRHLCAEEIESPLFFEWFFEKVKHRYERLQKKWSAYRVYRAEQGEAVKDWQKIRLVLWLLPTVIFSGICLYIYHIYSLELEMIVCWVLGMLALSVNRGIDIWMSMDMEEILDDIAHISEDDYEKEEPVLSRRSAFRRSEVALLGIQKNRKEDLERRLQSERMKIDLITNVSHDLKTPLTSIIGCIDLLKQTEGLPKEAEEYVKLLSVKAERLREMVQDVFEMAKATSRSQELHMERLDMARLIRQTLADMQDRMDASGLAFRIKMEDREIPFTGDGKKLYRVYQNLIENTLKYSMRGSRVYIVVKEKHGKVITSIRNTSAQEMDFEAEEIMERFTRGDKSRTTEGNGLGLAIAKSFTEACGGSLQVTLDGDLFKVETVFKMDS